MFKSNGGFTLVELIVVIAILGLLAGIATPVYSSYVERANKAADEAAVVVIDQAIGAACALNGVAPADATVTFTGAQVTAISATGADAAKLLADYNSFYAGNAVPTLKYYSGLGWSQGNITFTESN